jgi:hypothetical protein
MAGNRRRKGAMLAFVGVSMVALLGAVALVLDAGLGSRQRRIAQTSADAGALAAAHEIARSRQDLVDTAARAETARNGFISSEVTVHYPPASGLFAGNPNFAEVLIQRNVQTLLGGLFDRSSWDVRARAVAGVSTTSLNCIYSLDPSGVSLQLNSGASITANCGINANGTLDLDPGADLTASSISTGVANTHPSADISPAPGTGAPASPNPLAHLDTVITNYVTARVPALGTCTQSTQLVVSGDMTIGPGTYCGGIRVSSGSFTLTMTPGTYIMAGGGLRVETSGRIAGTGVTIINTNGPVNNPATYAPFYFGNGSKCNITAPTSGQFEGLLLVQDPTAGVSGTTYVNTFACADDTPLGGSIYLPTQTAYFQGSNNFTQINGAVIASNVEVASGTSLVMNMPVNSNSVVKRVSLVE